MARNSIAGTTREAGSAELVPRLKLQSSIPSLRSDRRGRPCSKKNPKNSRTTRLSHSRGHYGGVRPAKRYRPPPFLRSHPRADGTTPSAPQTRDPVHDLSRG